MYSSVAVPEVETSARERRFDRAGRGAGQQKIRLIARLQTDTLKTAMSDRTQVGSQISHRERVVERVARCSALETSGDMHQIRLPSFRGKLDLLCTPTERTHGQNMLPGFIEQL